MSHRAHEIGLLVLSPVSAFLDKCRKMRDEQFPREAGIEPVFRV